MDFRCSLSCYHYLINAPLVDCDLNQRNECDLNQRNEDSASVKEDVSGLISSLDMLSFEKTSKNVKTSNSIKMNHKHKCQEELSLVATNIQIALQTLICDLLPVLMISFIFFNGSSTLFPMPSDMGVSYHNVRNFHDVVQFLSSMIMGQVNSLKEFLLNTVVIKNSITSCGAIDMENVDDLKHAIEIAGMSLIVSLLVTNALHCFVISENSGKQLSIRCYFTLYVLYVDIFELDRLSKLCSCNFSCNSCRNYCVHS